MAGQTVAVQGLGQIAAVIALIGLAIVIMLGAILSTLRRK